MPARKTELTPPDVAATGRRQAEIREAAVKRVVEGGEKQADVARSLRIPPQTLNNWVKTFRATGIAGGTASLSKRNNEVCLARLTFGAVVARLRTLDPARTRSTDDFARDVLKIGGSTLREIEAGSHKGLPQVTLARPLAAEFGLSFPAMLLFVGLVRAIDATESVKHGVETAKAFNAEDPKFGFFVRALADAGGLPGKKRAVLLKQDQLVSQLLDVLRMPAADRGSQAYQDPVFQRLSPVLKDAIDSLAERLQVFHPALNATSLEEWESQNDVRIRRVCSFYTDPTILHATWDKFSWGFLQRSSTAHPKYLLIVGSENERHGRLAEEVKRGLEEKFPQALSEAITVITLREDDSRKKAFLGALLFDSHEGTLYPGEVTPVLQAELSKDPRYVRITTLHLYELEQTGRIRRDPTYVAFADNSVGPNYPSPAASAFLARSLPHADVKRLHELFTLAAQPYGVVL
jgi:transposase-like protein